MKFGITIVWFNPSAEQKNSLLAFLQTHGCPACIVDNSPVRDTDFESVIHVFPEIHYIYNNNLGGIAGGFNRGGDYLFNQNVVDYFFTMDQDSELTSEFFNDMVAFSEQNHADLACPNFYDRNAKTYGTFVLLTPSSYVISTSGVTHFCISSGMCISRKAWFDLGHFNEDLIIDHVDTDYALRAYVRQIPILVNYNQCLNHAIGERNKHKFLGVTIKPNHHSYIRKYYIVRNGTWLSFTNFKAAKGYFKLNIMRVTHETLSVILYEKDKRRKLAYIIKGLKDAIKGNLGAVK